MKKQFYSEKLGILLLPVVLLISGESCADNFSATRTIASEITNGPTFRRLAGQFLSICIPQSRTCKRVKMPKSLGKVEEIFPGPFIDRADASWIALSNSDSFLCSNPTNTQKVVCVRVDAKRFPIEHAQLKIGIHRDGHAGIFAIARTSQVEKGKLAAISYQFNRAVENAAVLLQGESDGVGMRSFNFGNTTNVCDDEDPGPPPAAGCNLVGGQWECPEIVVTPGPVDSGSVPWPVPYPDFPGDEPPSTDVPACF